MPDDYEPRPLLPLDPTTQVLPGESDGTLTPYDGYDGVVNPGLASEDLAFTDDDGRIGSTPNSGSDEPTPGDGSTTSSGGSSESRETTTTTAADPAAEEGTEPESTTTTEAEGL